MLQVKVFFGRIPSVERECNNFLSAVHPTSAQFEVRGDAGDPGWYIGTLTYVPAEEEKEAKNVAVV